MALSARSSSRIRNPPQVYTPSRNNATISHTMNYNLNSKKVLEKKIEASERELDCDVQLKSGTLVITCSAASYEILKKAIYEHYNNSLDKSIVVHTKRSKLDNTDISTEPVITEESISVRNRQGRSNKQLYRINLFNTTSRIDVNGYKLDEFIQNHLETICDKMKGAIDYKTLNKKIGEICKRSLTNVQNTKDSETIHSHSQNSCSKSIAKRQTVQLNGNNGKITEFGQVEENINKVSAIENAKNKNLDEQDHITTIYTPCLSDELVTHQREGLLDTSYEIRCHQCNEYILDAEPAIDCIRCTNWYHIKCTNEQQVHLESYICAMCGTLDETLPYEETSLKQLVITETEPINHKNSPTIDREGDTELKQIREVNNKTPELRPPVAEIELSNMTTKAAPQIVHSQANCVHPLTIDGDKPKQKRQKKKEHTDQTRLETQLAECKARITMLEETNKDYQNTIQLLTAKLGIPNPTIRTTEHKTHDQQSCFYRLEILESQIMDKLGTLQKDMNHKFENTNMQMKHNMEMNEMKCKINILEDKEKHTSCNMQTTSPRAQNLGHLEQAHPSIVHTHAHGQHNSQKYEMGTNSKNQDHIHKGYNRPDIYTEPPPTQYNKRYQDNDIQQFNWHQPMQRSEYQQIKKQSSHQTPVHYQIPTGDIPPKINTPWPSNQHRTSQHDKIQQSEYQQIKKQSSHQTPVHYQIPTGDIPPKINTPWPSNQHRTSQHDKIQQNSSLQQHRHRARRQNGEYRTLNLQWRKSQNRDKTPLVNRESMGEGGNQQIPENLHTNPTNGSRMPFLGAGRATTATWHRTINHDPPTQL